MKTNTIELYIHIPFCKSKCRYCDFCSFRAEEETIHAYLGKLKEELIFWGKKLAARDVVTVFIGGGTPSYLRREDIQMDENIRSKALTWQIQYNGFSGRTAAQFVSNFLSEQ